MFVCLSVCTSAYMCICVLACLIIHMPICMNAHAITSLCVYLLISTSVYIYSVCIFVYLYVRLYVRHSLSVSPYIMRPLLSS